jgi:DNA-binding protein HU-beta
MSEIQRKTPFPHLKLPQGCITMNLFVLFNGHVYFLKIRLTQVIDRGEVKGMNKSDLITKVAEGSELSKKDATKAVEAVFEAITEALQSGDKVQLVGFGNFEVRERSARKGRNPQTGEEIEIAASKVPSFKPGKALRDVIQ